MATVHSLDGILESASRHPEPMSGLPVLDALKDPKRSGPTQKVSSNVLICLRKHLHCHFLNIYPATQLNIVVPCA